MSKKYPIPSGYMPLNYNQINDVEGHLQPSMLKYCNSVTYAYWQRSLFQRAISTIEFKNLPDTWGGSVKDFFYWCIFSYGFVEQKIIANPGIKQVKRRAGGNPVFR